MCGVKSSRRGRLPRLLVRTGLILPIRCGVAFETHAQSIGSDRCEHCFVSIHWVSPRYISGRDRPHPSLKVLVADIVEIKLSPDHSF